MDAAGRDAARTRHRDEAVPGGGGSIFLRQRDRHNRRGHVLVRRVGRAVVCTENFIRIDWLMESPNVSERCWRCYPLSWPF